MSTYKRKIRFIGVAVLALPVSLVGLRAQEKAGGERHPPGFVFQQGVTAATPLAGHNVEVIAGGYSVAGEVVAQAPYSAEAVTEMVQTLADGNRIVRKNSTMIYRDSQGRTRREQQIGTIGPWGSADESRKMIFIHDPVAGVHYVIDTQNKAARKMTPPRFEAVTSGAPSGARVERYQIVTRDGEQVHENHWVSENRTSENVNITVRDARPHMTAGDVATESLGTQIMEGLEVEGTRTTQTIPEGAIGNERPIQIVTENWFSPELQTALLTVRKDPRFGETTYRLANVSRVEPLSSLFEVPPGYTVEEGPAFMHRMMRHRAEPAGSAKEK